MSQSLLLGAHMSIAGGIEKSVENALLTGCTTMQIFTKNNKSWFAPPIKEEDAKNFKNAVKRAGLKKIMAHSSYLINIASSNSDVIKKSVKSLILELQRAQQLDIPYLILHPGAHTGNGIEKGIQDIAINLSIVLSQTSGKTKILLETAAGQGTTIGSTFRELQEMLELCSERDRLGVCLDTCHIFAAGYDISSIEAWDNTLDLFNSIIGMDFLNAIHLNDSLVEKGEKKDRHAKIGLGKIPIEVFAAILKNKKLIDVPKVLETPTENPLLEYKQEISMLKQLIALK